MEVQADGWYSFRPDAFWAIWFATFLLGFVLRHIMALMDRPRRDTIPTFPN